MVKAFTTDTLATVRKCIIKYQFFMKVFKVLNRNGAKLEIEKIDYLPLADRFMDILVGNDPDVGLSLKLDENRFDEKDLKGNLLYINNNVIFNNLKGSQCDKTRTAIKDKLKDGLIDVLNFYIHYPQMVDASQLINSWHIMKLFVIRCLSI